MNDTIAYPVKTRDIKNVITDSTRWNYVTFREDDIVVATYAKTGTTWTQQIVCQLIHQGEDAPLFDQMGELLPVRVYSSVIRFFRFVVGLLVECGLGVGVVEIRFA